MPLIRNRFRSIAVAAALLAAAVFIYFPGLYGPFVFDDLTNILLAPRLRITDISLQSLRDAAFWQEDTGMGRPLAMASFALNYYFTQFDPFYFKATNLAIHLLNGLLIYLLAVRLLRQHTDRTDQAFTLSQAQASALLVSGIWLIHPLNLTSVLYVVQRMTSLSTLFILLGLLAYVEGRQRILKGRISGLALAVIAPLACGAVAVLAKENGVLLPLYMLVVEIFFFRFAAADEFARWIKIYWALVAIVPLIGGMALVSLKPEYVSRVFDYQHRDFSLIERLLTEARVLWFYIRLVVLPVNSEMGIYHDDFAISHGLLEPWSTTAAVIGIIGLVATAVVAFRRAPVLGFGIAWFLAGQLLESTVLPLELVHEHRNYLPQVGVIFAISYYFARFSTRYPDTRRAQQVLLVLYVGLLGAGTYARAGYWKNDLTLHTHHVLSHPNSARSHTALAILLHEHRQYEQARIHFLRAVELEPHDSTAWIRLTHHYYLASKTVPEPILKELERCLATCPYSNVTLWTFDPLLKATEKDSKLNLRLIRMYGVLAERTDSNVGSSWRHVAYRTLGFAYRQQNLYIESIAYLQKARNLQPLPVYDLLQAEIYFKTGDKVKSREKLEQAGRELALFSEEEQQRWKTLNKKLGLGANAKEIVSN